MKTRKRPSKALLDQLRRALEAERLELAEQCVDFEAEADINRWRDAGSDDDPADNGSASFERDRAVSLGNMTRRLLGEIEAALARMDAGTYGICERCGEAIERERLEVIPYATMCVEDKRLAEHGR